MKNLQSMGTYCLVYNMPAPFFLEKCLKLHTGFWVKAQLHAIFFSNLDMINSVDQLVSETLWSVPFGFGGPPDLLKLL